MTHAVPRYSSGNNASSFRQKITQYIQILEIQGSRIVTKPAYSTSLKKSSPFHVLFPLRADATTPLTCFHRHGCQVPHLFPFHHAQILDRNFVFWGEM